ncbi:MAG TPA: FAD:protein FMN transferase [Lacunisphaera sp.]|nr:FAD:protein FMN transferase [Lacunisphaera sp.]
MNPVMTASASAPPRTTAGAGLNRLAFRALGTHCEVQYHATPPGTAPAFEQAVRAWVENFEARYSRFRPDSMVSRINSAAGRMWIEIDREMEDMLDVCASVHTLTGGIIDSTAGPLLLLWDYHRPKPVVPSAAQIAAARLLASWHFVQRRPGRVFLPNAGMSLDFGGWGKEWAVDAVAQLAVRHGILHVLVDFGHDIRCIGTPPDRPAWHVGLEDPFDPGRHRESVALMAGRAIASSGDYLRGFTAGGRRYGHIIDPRTGEPVAHGCRQVTVIADTCFQAGLLSTTAFVLGPDAGLAFIRQFPGAEALIISDTGRAETRGFWNHVVT